MIPAEQAGDAFWTAVAQGLRAQPAPSWTAREIRGRVRAVLPVPPAVPEQDRTEQESPS